MDSLYSASYTLPIYEGLCSIWVCCEMHNKLRIEYSRRLAQYSRVIEQQARSNRTVPSQGRLFQPSHHWQEARKFTTHLFRASYPLSCCTNRDASLGRSQHRGLYCWLQQVCLEGLEGMRVDNIKPQKIVSFSRWSRCDHPGFRPTKTMSTSGRRTPMRKFRNGTFLHSVRSSPSLLRLHRCQG